MDNQKDSFAKLVLLSFQNKTLKNIVFSSPKDKETQKIKMNLCEVRGEVVLRCEYFFSEGRVKQENISGDKVYDCILSLCDSFLRCDLNDSGGTASLMTSKKGKITLVKHGKIGEGSTNVASVDKEKNYILNGKEAFLYHLGISDKNGRVHDKKQSKFRQINRFLEYVGDMMKYLPKEGKLRIADLCCGKSYLSFAVYYYITEICKREVLMDCMDLKKSVMEYCSGIAELCSFDGMRFKAGDVTKYECEGELHMVISLHACDTATDIVLERAVSLNSWVILSTPCCHRDLSRKINCEELRFVSASSVLKSKMCDALTDALRVLKLEAEGYIAEAVELIDPEDTPKNVLIRARKNKNLRYGNKKAEEYNKALEFLTGKSENLF